MKMKTTLTVLLILELYGLSSGLNKTHVFVNQIKKWNCAQRFCRNEYHDLSTFTNESEQQQFLANANNQIADAWVGLYKESGFWKWSGGDYARDIFWDPFYNQPGGNKDCAYLYRDTKKLHDENCTKGHNFFCMTIEFVPLQQNKSWEGALEYCRNNYNDLASLSSRKKMDSALEKITQAETDYVWTGLRFLAGDWRWINGEDLDFTFWSESQQPQCPAGNLRCGAMDKQTGVWSNRDCEEKLNFLCQ